MCILKELLKRIRNGRMLNNWLILETRRKNRIPNEPPLPALKRQRDFDEKSMLDHYKKRYEPLDERTGILDHYNCHGLTFADRRTFITKDSAIQTILRDDGYEQIIERDLLEGDIILYMNKENGIIHSGVVIEKPGKIKAGPIFPRVVSKWGSYWEFIHWANRCPYYEEGSILSYFRVNH